MGDLTRNFSLREFRCTDGTSVPDDLRSNILQLATNLQKLRDHLSKPIHVNSGYRTVIYNKSVGGATSSQHLYAKAADITIKDMKPKEVYQTIEKLIGEGLMVQGGMGLYSSFVHYDIRGSKTRW
ncbi:MAG: D-Ala-D-Ala carboxypeptidase family metallohydrolase [Gammaproteobacteria bacterium]|nr:D-Ala-D-Ala carboxypeptidase family metallohydrolase [Gammaproteobacteria bacterium]